MGGMAGQGKRIMGRAEIALILAAERLFAERGIEAVPLRQVNQAAKQRNMSAAHYHFGSREGLVQAVLSYRLPDLDRRRGAILDERSQMRDLRFYLEAFVLPLTEELIPRETGNFYIRFMQQYERYRRDYGLVSELTPHSVTIYRDITQLLGHLPSHVRSLRMGSLINLIHSVLAITEERLAKGEVKCDDVALIASNLIDMCVSALTAPPSPETQALVHG